jgi:sterol desaturase/sphingolipid hydroxylase (fatty acid hydroxylase superfamily)
MIIEQLQRVRDGLVAYVFAPVSSWNSFLDALKGIPSVFTDWESGMAWPYLLSSIVIAWILFLLSNLDRNSQTFLSFLFPSGIYRHPSAIADYWFYGVGLFLKALLIGPIIAGMFALGFKSTKGVCGWLGWAPPTTISSAGLIVAVLALFLLNDFILYVAHYLFHRVPVLWLFHRVHHSAEVLTPITARRFHPVEDLVGAFLQSPVAGMTMFLFQELPGEAKQVTLICGVSMFTFLFALSGRHLRHTHIWFSYGPLLSRLLISPSQHQIHHSVELRHLDKNLGDKFAIWDWMFGTLYVPKEREAFQVGLPKGEQGGLATVGQLYWAPIRETWGNWKAWSQGLFGLGAREDKLAGRTGGLKASRLRRLSPDRSLPTNPRINPLRSHY